MKEIKILGPKKIQRNNLRIIRENLFSADHKQRQVDEFTTLISAVLIMFR